MDSLTSATYGSAIVLEGEWADNTVVVAFEDLEHAYGWHHSPAYQEILPLRTENSDGATIIVDGVGENYRAASFLTKEVRVG